MGSTRYTAFGFTVWVALGLVCFGLLPLDYGSSNEAQDAQQSASASATTKPVGVVKTIQGTQYFDDRRWINCQYRGSGLRPSGSHRSRTKRFERRNPGQLQDVQVGDRILARGNASEDGNSVHASSVVVMKAVRHCGEAAAGTRRLAEARHGRVGEQSRCCQWEDHDLDFDLGR